jgi:AcrR family transcriptional regulator
VFDEVDAEIQGLMNDADGFVVIGIADRPEHHGAQTVGANLDAAATERAVLHLHLLCMSRGDRAERRIRADARRNLDALLKAAMAVFAKSGVDAPIRAIAEKAGVGVGTVYRHFPERSDLIAAVFRREIDACADAAPVLAAEHEPDEALRRWVERYVNFIAAKRGLAAALHSGDPAYDVLPTYFEKRLRPALEGLLNSAASAGCIRKGWTPVICWLRSRAFVRRTETKIPLVLGA